MHDGFGNPLDAYYSAETGAHVLSVHNADVHTKIVNKYFHQHTGLITTLAASVPAGGSAYEIDVLDATGFAVNDYLHMNSGSPETTHPMITAISAPTGPATFTLDRYLDIPHDIGDEVEKSIINMVSQDGTMAAPQEYWVGPEVGEVWHETRILFEMTHDSKGDLGTFGGIPALANGILFRARIDGQYGTFTNWKRMGDFKADMYNVEFDDRSGGQGLFGTSGRGTFTAAGAIVRLDGATGDRIELYVTDPVANPGINTFTMTAQGHQE